MKNKILSIIIPVYNEENTVVKLLDKVAAVELDVNKEIIIVNDGSTDASLSLIQEWEKRSKNNDSKICVFSKDNGGKGSAVRLGIENSTGDIVIIQDADLEYDPSDYKQCIEPILKEEAKVVYGSRELSNRNRIHSAPSFYLGGLIVTYWINLLYGSDLTDEPTCYKTFDGPLIRKILFKADKFDWEPEITSKLLKLGYEIKEVVVCYTPRKLDEGKKINWKDGVSALYKSFYWRFHPIKDEKKKILSWERERSIYQKCKRHKLTLLMIVALAFIIRLAFSSPGLSDPEKVFFRPDSDTYVSPAKALYHDGQYNVAPGVDEAAIMRVPGYPLFLAVLFALSKGNLVFCVIISCLISALTCVPIFYSGKLMGGWGIGAIASLLFCFSMTSIALSPLFLSDTLFTLLIAIQLYFFIRFYYKRIFLYLFISVAIAALATYVRPLNQLWIFPCIFLILILDKTTLKRKLIACAVCFFIFSALLFPWFLRNKLVGAGWRMDAISGQLIFHNGAVLLAKVNKESPKETSQELNEKINQVFVQNPEKYRTQESKINYKFGMMLSLIKQYPFSYFKLHFRPSILFPDMPNFLRNLKIVKGNKGAFEVLNKKNIFAMINHYFKGIYWTLIVASPLLLIAGLTYLLGATQLVHFIFRSKYYMFFCFLAFFQFYIFIPGPIAMPRYALPGFPFLCLMASLSLVFIISKFRRCNESTFHKS